MSGAGALWAGLLAAGLALATTAPAQQAQPAPAAEPRAGAGTADEPSTPEGVLRRRPGSKPQSEPGALPPPLPALPAEFVPVPDRWRIVESIGVHERWWDPYHQNTLKADRPVFGSDWFLNLAAVSDTVAEPRRLPTPVGVQGTSDPGSLDAFGENEQLVLVESLLASVSLIKGNTVFRPPDYEIRFTPVFNWNYASVREAGVLRADPARGAHRYDHHLAIQELFVDKHIANVSERYDFYSIRAGIQGFSSDFRGFLFQDNQPGVRLFGNYVNNRLQYNLAWFRRLEKDTNSGLNRIFPLRSDDVLLGNLYFQDFPVLGFTLQGTVVHNRNREGERRAHYDENGFLQRPAPLGFERPRNYAVSYLGLNGDGHFGRLNLTFGAYWALGEQDASPFTSREARIDAQFLAVEASVDRDWYRLKAYALYASGDENPFDDEEGGFDAIFENPQFAGADTSFWQRQAIPFIGGGGVILAGRNALLPALRSSKEEGQSNFVNPGLRMLGVGADLDVLPELRLIGNLSWLAFDDTSVLSAARNQGPIDEAIGADVSLALVYRPLFIQNVVFRLSGAALFPGRGFEQLFDDRGKTVPFYSVLANLILTY